MRRVWKLALTCGLGMGLGMGGDMAQAVQWISLTRAQDLSFELDTDSASKDPDGYLVYSTRTIWRDAAQPPGATANVAVSLSRYQMNCHARQWRLVESRYRGLNGLPAGVYKPAGKAWVDIAPGTVMEKIYTKLC